VGLGVTIKYVFVLVTVVPITSEVPMKKTILIFLIVIILVIAGVAVFIATFDINKYNKPIADRVSEMVGNPVEIGKLSLRWQGRLLLGADKFQIFSEKNGVRTAVLSFDKADLALDVMPLLERKIAVSSVSVTSPRITVLRTKDGKIEVYGYDPASSPSATKTNAAPSVAAGPALALNVDSIMVRDGMVRFIDLAEAAPLDIVLDKIDADIKNVSLTSPVKFDVKAAFCSEKQNAEVSGTAGGFVKSPVFVKDLDMSIDLGKVDFETLKKYVPAIQKTGLKSGPKGVLKAKVKNLEMSDNKIDKLLADLSFTEGALSLTQINIPIENIMLSVTAENEKVTISNFSAKMANSTLKSSGVINNIYGEPMSDLSVNADVPGVKAFTALIAGGKQFIDGNLSFSYDGNMNGTSWERISKTLSGSGTFALEKGVLVETNLLKQSLGALEMFPGILEKVNSYLPASLKESMGKDYTVLKPIRQSFTIKNGTVSLPAFSCDTDFAGITGSADLTLSGAISGKGSIVFTEEMSNAMIKAVPEIAALADGKKITFPVTFKGQGSDISVMPDIKYIAGKTVMKKGQEMLSDLLKKTSSAGEKQAASGATSSGTSTTAASVAGTSSSLNTFMDKLKSMAKDAQKSTQSDSSGVQQQK